MEQAITIRPEPHVFADYLDEKFQQTVQADTASQSLRRIVSSQGARVYLTEKVIYPDEGGMLMKYKDVPYLRQGFVFPEAMDNVNNLKRVTVLFLAVLKGKGIRGRIGTFLNHYCRMADWMFQWYDPNSQRGRKIYLQDNRYRQSVRELIKFINLFLENLRIEVKAEGGLDNADFGRIIGTMVEYDNAYHWRMEDIFSETSKELLLKNPKKEINRLLQIYKSREKMGIDFKAEAIVKLFNWIFWIPGVKKAFKKTIESIDIEKLKTINGAKGEINDNYFMMNYGGYDFKGKTIEQRQKIWLEMTDGIVPERRFIPAQ